MKKQGGSLASDYVMGQFQRGCNSEFNNPLKIQYNVREIVNNYGSEYKTTGGSKNRQRGGDGIDQKVEGFLRKVVDNRVLDMYLKYLGITLLTPATLVPLALIMGKNTFSQVVNDIKKNDQLLQNGGDGFLDVKIPIIDDSIVGNGLKLAGITAFTVSPYTLIPLGLAMYIYNLHSNETKLLQTGGNCAMRANLSDGVDKAEFKAVSSVPVPKNFSSAYTQNGGIDPISFGNQWDKGHCRNPNLDWTNRGPDFSYKGGKKGNIKKGGTGHILGASVPNNIGQAVSDVWNGKQITPLRYADYINDDMQLRFKYAEIPPQPGMKLPYETDTTNYIATPTTNVCAMTESCGIPKSMAGGASSDWRSSQYSMSLNPMKESQFNAFNKTYSGLCDSNDSYTN